MSSRTKTLIFDLLQRNDIVLGGSRPFDIAVYNEKLFDRVMTQGTLGLGEAYMDGWWDAPAVDQFLHRLISSNAQASFPIDFSLMWSVVKGKMLNLQRMRISEVGEKHYDIGNDLYAAMLDPRMIYSCGYWANATTLAEAQEAKLDLICRKAGLKAGMRILDIGSGWGGLMKFAAERYGVEAVGVTISREQAAWAKANSDGLPVETRLQDYMSLDGQFDRIISVGMFEHVGYKNYRPFMKKVRSLLRDDGLFVLHTIGGNVTSSHGDPWTEKYVFPNGMLPSQKQMGEAAEGLFVMEDWHNFGADYDRTLLAWYANFEAAWPELSKTYDDRFHRMWRYYLLSFAATFRARAVQLWQIVYSPQGVSGGYSSIR
jgi:cyclopropane-fatty-acyl-phospholipid synthase